MKKALVIGAALSGTAVAKLLRHNDYEVIITDAKEIPNIDELRSLGIVVEEKGHPRYLEETDYDIIVKNPGIPNDVPFVARFLEKGYFMYNEIEVASSLAHYRYGAITGTNGKTTTTAILGELLKTLHPHNEAVGNIGFPLSSVVDAYADEKLAMAVEISAFQLLGIKNFHPQVSVCTNLTPDHADYFHSLEAYYRAKMKVYENQTGDDWFLLNIDDENCLKYAREVPCRTVRFSVKNDADLCLKGNVVYLYGEKLFDCSILKIPGLHNIQNAMVAAAMALKMGVHPEDIRKILAAFPGVKHRMQFVREINGVRYYNDSKGTNPESTIVALKAFEAPVILLAGGYDKKTGFVAIKPYLPLLKAMIVFGQTKEQLKEIYPEAMVVEDLAEATRKAYELANSGDVVLLSPMCASWDQYPNFEVRGDRFIDFVKDLT